MKTRSLFLSYRSSDAAKVDKIARDLTLLRYEDGTPRYTAWQDKHNLPPASPNWWDAIVDAIEYCDMFVFNLSRASLQSEVCKAELEYAHKRNRPIIPVVLDGEFFLNSQAGKYDLPKETWALVPDWLGQAQFLFYVETQFYSRFQEAVAVFERNWPRDIHAPRPFNPDSKSVHGSNHALYSAACDYAERLAFADAEKHFDALLRRSDEDYVELAAQWLNLIRRYAELIEIVEQRIPAVVFKRRWTAYQALFPNDVVEGIFDPRGFQSLTVEQELIPAEKVEQEPIAAEKAQRERIAAEKAERERISAEKAERERIATEKAERERIATERAEKERIAAENAKHERIAQQTVRTPSPKLMPAPFDWIEIPKKGYSIAKYPITNAQFAKFIEAGGYKYQHWWTPAGWEAKAKGWAWNGSKREWEETGTAWAEPRYWTDSKWNGAEQPVVGVSWYESVAFCLWLSKITDEKIMLPTEEQWQYAAQGDDGRTYPWGNDWDCKRCNNSVKPCDSEVTTPVRQYEGKPKGDSPFGVMDMAGNVWEWCLTDYDNKTNNINSNTKRRVLRGGSWDVGDADGFRCDFRDWNFPRSGGLGRGFRLSRS